MEENNDENRNNIFSKIIKAILMIIVPLFIFVIMNCFEIKKIYQISCLVIYYLIIMLPNDKPYLGEKEENTYELEKQFKEKNKINNEYEELVNKLKKQNAIEGATQEEIYEKNNIIEYIIKKIKEEYENNITITDLMMLIIGYKLKLLEFAPPNPDDLSEPAEEEKIADDIYLLQRYNSNLEDEHYNQELERILIDSYFIQGMKAEISGKEVTLGTYIDEYPDNDIFCKYNITAYMDINTKKRLHISNCKFDNLNENFDECFVDYKERLDNYDIKYDEIYREYFSDRLLKIKEKDSLNLEKYELSIEEKEFLINIQKKYNKRFSLVFKDGILSVSILGSYKEEDFIEFYQTINCIAEIIEKFMEI